MKSRKIINRSSIFKRYTKNSVSCFGVLEGYDLTQDGKMKEGDYFCYKNTFSFNKINNWEKAMRYAETGTKIYPDFFVCRPKI